MKSSLLKRLSQRYLLPHLAGVGIQRNLLYCEGIRCLLRGCVVESSSFDSNRFTVEAFVQPLYVPQESVVLTFGKRLGGGSGRRWSFDPSAETAIMADVLRAIQAEVETPEGKKYSDNAAPSVDAPRYVEAFPPLAEAKADWIKEDLKIPTKTSYNGTALFSFPIDKPTFDKRKQVTIRIQLYDRPTLVATNTPTPAP